MLWKMVLSAFSLESGLIGGVFAPLFFFGAVVGNIYHDINQLVLQSVQAATTLDPLVGDQETIMSTLM